jgi:Recombination endonuclease VII
MRTCPKCEIEKPVDEFNGSYSYCRWCKAAYDKDYRPIRLKKPNTREKNYKNYLKHNYKITLEYLINLWDNQEGKCPCCKKSLPHPLDWDTPKWAIAIDHDHTCCDNNKSCGKCVRGLLCRDCNLMLGHAKDKESTLANAIEYLAKTYMKEGK